MLTVAHREKKLDFNRLFFLLTLLKFQLEIFHLLPKEIQPKTYKQQFNTLILFPQVLIGNIAFTP